MLQLAEYNAYGFNPLKLDKKQLFSFLQGNFYIYLLILFIFFQVSVSIDGHNAGPFDGELRTINILLVSLDREV